jgi:SDR family mycofactocin-dependent oxidoreductase
LLRIIRRDPGKVRRLSGRFADRVALITGAARGQGRSHAQRLAEEGADIIALDICAQIESVDYPMSTPADLAETARMVTALGRRVITAQVDVRDLSAMQMAVASAVADLGRLDVVSANAGIFSVGPEAHLITEQRWRDVIDTNLTGMWHTAKVTVPHLLRGGGGSITFTSSAAGLRGYPNIAHYLSSKHGVVGLMRGLALELAGRGIRVNSIHPSQVDTGMLIHDSVFRMFLPNKDNPTVEDFAPISQTMNAMPVPWVNVIDVSHALAFLASDEARYITGVALPVDAGASIR